MKKWCSETLSRGYYADYKPLNFVDGQGVRNSLYVSGCPFACEGCYNKAAQAFDYGQLYTQELEERIIEDTRNAYVQGVTLLGGEPFLNTGITLSLARRVREEFGQTKDIWSWTGYTWEELQEETDDKKELLQLMDVLVDGRFELAAREFNSSFRGSSNQRVIDVKHSFSQGRVVLWES